jgi:hypothetical protein
MHIPMEHIQGHEGYERFEAAGVTYIISRSGRYAWPLMGRGTEFGGYDEDVARARGEEVDRDLPRDDQRVKAAGPAWKAMYEELRRRDR